MVLVHHLVSFALVMVCWWLAHVFAGTGRISGRFIASLFGLLALTVLTGALFRTLDIDLSEVGLLSKTVLTTLLITLGLWGNDARIIAQHKDP